MSNLEVERRILNEWMRCSELSHLEFKQGLMYLGGKFKTLDGRNPDKVCKSCSAK